MGSDVIGGALRVLAGVGGSLAASLLVGALSDNAQADEIDPSGSRIRFMDSKEFQARPESLWSSSPGGDDCQSGYWRGRSLTAEVAHCRMTVAGYTYTEKNFVLETHLPEVFSYLHDHRASLSFGDTDTLVGEHGLVNLRYFQFNDRADQYCVGYGTFWGPRIYEYDNILHGYVCSESAEFPLASVIARELHALGVDGEIDHVVDGP